MYGIQFVHFVFGKADGAELGEAKTEPKDNEEGQNLNVLGHFFRVLLAYHAVFCLQSTRFHSSPDGQKAWIT